MPWCCSNLQLRPHSRTVMKGGLTAQLDLIQELGQLSSFLSLLLLLPRRRIATCSSVAVRARLPRGKFTANAGRWGRIGRPSSFALQGAYHDMQWTSPPFMNGSFWEDEHSGTKEKRPFLGLRARQDLGVPSALVCFFSSFGLKPCLDPIHKEGEVRLRFDFVLGRAGP